MKTAQIQKAIEAHHWDYPTHLIPKGVKFIHTSDVIMIKNESVANIHANKVIHFSPLSALHSVFSFFGSLPFSWWVPAHEQNLIKILQNHHFSLIDEYIGLALHIEDFNIPHTERPFSFIDVKTDEHITKLIDVSAAIWGYKECAKESIFQQRKAYIDVSGDNGGYMICLDGETAVTYASYRYSQDGKTLYLSGAGVRPSYRKRGIYRELIYKRLQDAKDRGVVLATTQARAGHSAPILNHLGFGTYATYLQFARNGNEKES